MANSISRVVQTLIDSDLSLQDALQRDYGNYSAIARMLLPKVIKTLKHDVKLESVITSVKRARTHYSPLPRGIVKVIGNSTLSVHTDMAKISIEKSKEYLEKIRKTLAHLPGEFLQVIEGMAVITLISDLITFNKIRSMFPEKAIVDETQNLATVIIRSPDEIINTPGCVQTFYNAISRRHINIEESMSCFTETIIVLAMENASRVFSILTDLIAETRKT